MPAKHDRRTRDLRGSMDILNIDDSLSLACELLQDVLDNAVKMPSNKRDDVVELPDFVINNIKDFLEPEHKVMYVQDIQDVKKIIEERK